MPPVDGNRLSIMDEVFILLARSQSSTLKRLDLVDLLGGLTAVGFEHFTQFTKLQHLTLTECRVNDTDLGYLATQLLELQRLDINSCYRLTTAGVYKFTELINGHLQSLVYDSRGCIRFCCVTLDREA
jgi:hypothetical protein